MHLLLLAPLLLASSAPARAQDEEALREEVSIFFERLGAAVEERDTKGIQSRLNVTRMFEDLEALGVELPPGARFGFTFGLVTAFKSGQLDGLIGRVQVRSIEPLESGDLRVVTRMRNPDFDVFAYIQWWLAKGEDGWQLYDWMDLDAGLRATLVMASVFDAAEGGSGNDVMQFVTAMQLYAEYLAMGDWDGVEEQLAVMADLEVPSELRGFYYLNLAAVRTVDEDYATAVEALERAEELAGDVPMLDYQWTVTLLGMERPAEALEHAHAYRARMGGDAEIDCLIGIALVALDRPDEAWDVFMRGLDDDPRSADLVLEIALLAGGERADELRARARAALEAGLIFDDVAAYLLEDEQGLAGLEVLCDELDAVRPDDPNVEYWRAEILAYRGEYSQAAELLLEALPRSGDEREYYLGSFLDHAASAGRGVWAYEQVPDDALEAFEALAYGLADMDDPGPFDELAALHEEEYPDDPRLPFHRARSLRWQGEYDEAEEQFALAAERLDSELAAEELLELRVDNLVLCGRVEEAYALEPKEQAWHWILDSCQLWEDGDVLLEAVALRRADLPQDVELDAWTGLARFLRGEEELAAEALLAAELETPRVVEWGYLWMFQDALVRSCVRVDRAADALPYVGSEEVDPYLVLIVRAHLDDIEATVAAVRACLDLGWDRESLLLDDDLGTRLAQPDVAELLGWQ